MVKFPNLQLKLISLKPGLYKPSKNRESDFVHDKTDEYLEWQERMRQRRRKVFAILTESEEGIDWLKNIHKMN